MMAKGRFAFINRGKRLISFVFVENLCYGIQQLVHAKEIDGIYNVIDGNMTWKEWVAKWEQVIGKKVRTVSVPYPFLVPITASMVGFYKLFGIKKSPPLNFYRINIMRKDLAFVNTRISNEIGYHPPTDFEDSLKETLDFYYETKEKKKKK
jgi:nucleoside-diphosphate-sugar epimerase